MIRPINLQYQMNIMTDRPSFNQHKESRFFFSVSMKAHLFFLSRKITVFLKTETFLCLNLNATRKPHQFYDFHAFLMGFRLLYFMLWWKIQRKSYWKVVHLIKNLSAKFQICVIQVEQTFVSALYLLSQALVFWGSIQSHQSLSQKKLKEKLVKIFSKHKKSNFFNKNMSNLWLFPV